MTCSLWADSQSSSTGESAALSGGWRPLAAPLQTAACLFVRGSAAKPTGGSANTHPAGQGAGARAELLQTCVMSWVPSSVPQ